MSPEIERQLRVVSIAPHLRVAVARLPQPVRLDATLPEDPAALPLGARQLVKLALEGGRLRLGNIAMTPSRDVTITLSVGEKRLALDASALAATLGALLPAMLGALFDPSDVTHLLVSLAFQSSSLTTLRQITARMLASTDVDEALYLMLAGITSGYGLSFDRAALFMWDAAKGGFVGAKAIGPYDNDEAHRIWEAIELEGMTMERLIDDYADRRFDTRFQQRIQATTLVAGSAQDDEVRLALDEGREDVRFERVTPVNAELGRLGASGEMVLASVKTRGQLLGLIFADNCYSKERITKDQVEHLRLYVDQTALVWENLSLLARVAEHARTDALTGILNRRAFETRFEEERSRSTRSSGSLSLIVIDVDHFKNTNDSQGHEAGDAVLRVLGHLLGASLRTHDVLARYGGDEFVALLPDANVEQLAAVASRIGAAARARDISLSIGGATWPQSCATIETLFAVADEQLYLAKRGGRGCAFVNGSRLDYAVVSPA